MKMRGKALWGMVAVVGFFAVAPNGLAHGGTIPVAPLFADVNAASPGAEVIMPYFKVNDANLDGYAESQSYWYNVYPYNNSTTKLYATTTKTAAFPAVTCTNATWRASWSDPQFLRYGKWAITGHDMNMECGSQDSSGEVHNTFIYIADVSAAGGMVNTFSVNNAELQSIELIDYNNDGKKDLLIAMTLDGMAVKKMRFVVKNLDTWVTISDKTYTVSNVDN